MSNAEPPDSLLKGLKGKARWRAICIEVNRDHNKILLNKHLQKEWVPLCNRAAGKARRIARRLVPRDTRALWRSIKDFHADHRHQKGFRGLKSEGWFKKRSAVIAMISKDEEGWKKTIAVEHGRKPPEAGGWRRQDAQPFIGPAQKEVGAYFKKQFEKAVNRAVKAAYNESKNFRDQGLLK